MPFLKQGVNRFRQFVMRVGESRDYLPTWLRDLHPGFLQPPETLPRGSALTASFPSTETLHPRPLPQRRKSKPQTGRFGVLYTVAPVNLFFTDVHWVYSRIFSLLFPKHTWLFLASRPFLVLTTPHPPSSAWAARPLQLSPLSRVQSLPPPTKCLSASAAPSGVCTCPVQPAWAPNCVGFYVSPS